MTHGGLRDCFYTYSFLAKLFIKEKLLLFLGNYCKSLDKERNTGREEGKTGRGEGKTDQ